MQISSFPPIESASSKILILGTMPSVQSLEKHQFYGHPQNHFWKIMFRLFDEPYTTDYSVKTSLLLNHDIALWDVLKHCVRPGSMDADITNAIPNDFEDFFKTHSIRKIFCNGQSSYKYVKKFINSDIPYVCLPSTSPANARISFDQKFEQWQVILDDLI